MAGVSYFEVLRGLPRLAHGESSLRTEALLTVICTKSIRRGLPVALGLGAGVACSARSPEPAGPPPIPLRTGALTIDVVYPPEGSVISAVDSNFIFGTVANGRASLTINGQTVQVEPNGAFIAWLPVPPAVDDTLAIYELLASLALETERRTHVVRLPRPPARLPPHGVAIDSASLSPRGLWWVREGEGITVRARASPGARVRLVTPDGQTVSLERAESDSMLASASAAYYEGILIARAPLGRGGRSARPPPVPADPEAVAEFCAPVRSRDLEESEAGEGEGEGEGETTPLQTDIEPSCARVEAIVADDTARVAFPLDLWILQDPPPFVELHEAPSFAGRDRLVAAQAGLGGTVTWRWTDGVRAIVTGRRNDAIRLGLDADTEAWVPIRDLRWLSVATPMSRARLGAPRITALSDWLEVRLPLDLQVPYDVSIDGLRVSLTLYGAYATSGTVRYGAADEFLRSARWEQRTSDRYVFHLDLARRPWGYRVTYPRGGGALVLHVRRPPIINTQRPLAGRVIAVDPGHPPAGARGPTRLYEGDANLAVAMRLRRLLEAEGATVIMTRTDGRAVRLYDRVELAELLGAELLVSIHNNALPDGVDPFTNNGTSVFYFHPQYIDLAGSIQRRLLEALGLTDLGIARASLALVRPTWMPSVLTEAAFMMIPAQESGLRDPAFLESYALGILEGLRDFLREREE